MHNWIITLHNKGDLASTNITLEYMLIIKKLTFNIKIREGVDDVGDNIDLVNYKKISKTINIPYMGANESKDISVLSLFGQFPAAELFIIKLSTNKNKFITKSVKIGNYFHPDGNMGISPEGDITFGFSDSQDVRSFVGLYNKSE